jgi:ubiquinone/menaquinone biosynthesis C-methylase UbiE
MTVRTEQIRQAAIDSHDREAGKFVAWYNALSQSRFSNAFAYGRSKIDALVDELFASLPKGGKVLDVGCGTGEHLHRALDRGLKAYGVEPAPAMLEVARRNVPEAEIKQGVATSLPFGDGEFDMVMMVEVLRYLDRADTDAALREARRVLKPGGLLFVTLVNRWALDGFYILQRARSVVKRKQFDQFNPYCLFHTPASARRDLAQAGFDDVRIEGRLLAPLRFAYKASERFGGWLASKLEEADDRLHHARWTQPFAGHLIAIGRTPEAAKGKATTAKAAKAKAGPN